MIESSVTFWVDVAALVGWMVESSVFFGVDVVKLLSWVVELSPFCKYIVNMQTIF